MRRTVTHLLEGLSLTLILVAVTLGSRWAVTTAPHIAWSWAPPTATPIPTPLPTATPTITPTPTHTPTLNPIPTATSSPTSTPTPAPPTPPPPPLVIVATTESLTQPLPIPSPMPLVSLPGDVINILLLGKDQGANTDTIVIASINPAYPSVTLLSIPRDLYVWIPGYGFDRINTAWAHGQATAGGGPALLRATIEYNLGIWVHYYACVDFAAFIRIVDALGGVDIPIECPLHDTFPDEDSPTGQSDIDLEPGVHHLSGKQALWYSRSRALSRTPTTDFDRNRRHQKVLRGLWHQILKLDVIPKIPELWDALNQNVETDLGLDEVIWLGWVGSRLESTNVKSRFISRSVVQSWVTPNGAQVLVPNYEAIQGGVAEALAPPASARAEQPAVRVEVWNGTGHADWGEVAADRLRWEGFLVVSISPAGGYYPRTQIVDFTTTAKGSALSQLMQLYRRSPDDVISEPNPESPVQYRIILGADYYPCLSAPSRWAATPTPAPTPTAVVTSAP